MDPTVEPERSGLGGSQTDMCILMERTFWTLCDSASELAKIDRWGEIRRHLLHSPLINAGKNVWLRSSQSSLKLINDNTKLFDPREVGHALSTDGLKCQ